MKVKVEKLRVAVYGKRQNYRFSFIIRVPLSYDTQTDVQRMIRVARREAKRIFKESKTIYLAKWGGHLEKIVWLIFENGLKTEVM